MMSYSDVDFAKICNDKVGNVVVFKKILREYELIGKRVQLTDEHVSLFKEAKKLKIEQHKNWVDSFHEVLAPLANPTPSSTPSNIATTNTDSQSCPGQTNSEILNVLYRILGSLERIEQKS